MTSDRKSAANRRNSCKSCGPRTAAGKAIAPRNALRHGLSAAIYRRPAPSCDIERLAMAICGHNESAALHEQARVIAANQQVLCAINAQKIAVIERLREPTAIALAKGDNSRELATARFMQAWLAHREIELLTPKVLDKYKSQMPPPFESKVQPTDGLSGDFDIVPLHVKVLLEESSSIEQQQRALAIARKLIEEQERDEHEALEEATADLVRLERYERRAWSRQKRAIRSFMNLKMIVDMKPVATSDRSSHEQSPT